MKTYNVHFNDSNNSNDLGLKQSFEYCQQLVSNYNSSYFADYINGTVSIACNEDGENIFEKEILCHDFLSKFGEIIDTTEDGTVQLISCYGNEYVVLSDNRVIIREEDNSYGSDNAFFPY